MELLERAKQSGYFAPLKRLQELKADTDIHALRERPDFQEFVKSLDQITRRWLSSGGDFQKCGDGHWSEVFKDGGEIRFLEVASTPEYVELYDAARDIGVRLYSDKMTLKQPRMKEFIFFRKGAWDPEILRELLPAPRRVKR